jgi:protein DGCR14
MSLRRAGEEKALIVVQTRDGGGRQVEAPPQKVIEEESYIDSISSILDRDFFPELPKLRAYNEWLDAVQARDYVKMAEIRSRMRRSDAKRDAHGALMTPALQLRDMAEETHNTESKRSKTSEILESVSSAVHQVDGSQLALDAKLMSLDEFLGKYTSEDDESFSRLMEKEVTEARRVYQEIHAKALIEHAKMVKEGKLIGWKEYDPAHRSVFSAPRSLPLTFTPEEMKQGEKAVIPENTRFPEGGPNWSSTSSSSSKSSTISSTFKTPALPSTSSQPLDALLYDQILKRRHGSLFEESDDNGPKIRDYPLVATPKISANHIDQSPMITWGEIADDAIRLDDSGMPLLLPPADPNSSEPARSGFTVPSLSEKSVSTNKLLKKASSAAKRKGALSSHPNASPSLSWATSPKLGIKTPTHFQMTPDTQLRSSYATPKLRSGSVMGSVASTPLSRPTASIPSTPNIKR